MQRPLLRQPEGAQQATDAYDIELAAGQRAHHLQVHNAKENDSCRGSESVYSVRTCYADRFVGRPGTDFARNASCRPRGTWSTSRTRSCVQIQHRGDLFRVLTGLDLPRSTPSVA